MNKYITIIALALSSLGLKAQTTHQVTVTVNQGPECPKVTSLRDLPLFEVFPNPTLYSFQIKSESLNAEVVLINIQGKEVFRAKLEKGELNINSAQFRKGIYILHVIDKYRNDKTKLSIQ